MYDEQHYAREDPKTLPERVRRAVLDRDNYQCQSCGTSGENRLQLHHLEHRSQGGRHVEDNLVTLCAKCHRLIHDGFLDIFRIEWRAFEWCFFAQVLRRINGRDPRFV